MRRYHFLFAGLLNVNWETKKLSMTLSYLLVSQLFAIASLPLFSNGESRLVISLCSASVSVLEHVLFFTSPLSVTLCLRTSFLVRSFQTFNQISDIPERVIWISCQLMILQSHIFEFPTLSNHKKIIGTRIWLEWH